MMTSVSVAVGLAAKLCEERLAALVGLEVLGGAVVLLSDSGRVRERLPVPEAGEKLTSDGAARVMLLRRKGLLGPDRPEVTEDAVELAEHDGSDESDCALTSARRKTFDDWSVGVEDEYHLEGPSVGQGASVRRRLVASGELLGGEGFSSGTPTGPPRYAVGDLSPRLSASSQRCAAGVIGCIGDDVQFCLCRTARQ